MTKTITSPQLITKKQEARLKNIFSAALCEGGLNGEMIIENQERFFGIAVGALHQLSLPSDVKFEVDPMETWTLAVDFDQDGLSTGHALYDLLETAGLEEASYPWEKIFRPIWRPSTGKLEGRYLLIASRPERRSEPFDLLYAIRNSKRHESADPFELAFFANTYPQLLNRYAIAALGRTIREGWLDYALWTCGSQYGFGSLKCGSCGYIGEVAKPLRFLARLK